MWERAQNRFNARDTYCTTNETCHSSRRQGTSTRSRTCSRSLSLAVGLFRINWLSDKKLAKCKFLLSMTQTKVKFRILQQMPQAKTSRERMQKNCRSHKKAAANKRTFLVLLQLLGLDAVDGKQKREWLDEQTDGRIFEPTAGWMDGWNFGWRTNG